MFGRIWEPLLRFTAKVLKLLAALIVIRGVLYAVGFRYNIPVLDDIFRPLLGRVMSLGASPKNWSL